MGMATVLTGCQNMDSNGLLSSGAEAFQAYTLSDAQVKALSDQSCKDLDSKATIAPSEQRIRKKTGKKSLPLWGITSTASR
ncbi:Putative metalloprotease yggG [Salmonella bongori]|nr:Putative metalloprotease yggG [Salmonella bongori]